MKKGKGTDILRIKQQKKRSPMAEQFVIKKAAFVTSAGINTDYPAALTHEIALVGRSNAGKSSLINCLCTNKKLARISAEPSWGRLCQISSVMKGMKGCSSRST